jgi:hypothetical protein
MNDKIKLQYPVKIAETTYSELTMRRIKVKDRDEEKERSGVGEVHLYRPIYADYKSDTPETIRQIYDNNVVYDTICIR